MPFCRNQRFKHVIGQLKRIQAFSTLTSVPTDAFRDKLNELLQKHGIDISLYGHGAAKSVTKLLKEITKGDCQMVVTNKDQLVRQVSLLQIAFVYKGKKVLVEVLQGFGDGRIRQRNMLISEKIITGEDLKRAVRRAMKEELDLNITADQAEGLRFSKSQHEQTSPSYPQLQCMCVICL